MRVHLQLSNFHACTEIDRSRADCIINSAYLPRSSGFSPNSAVFQAFTLLDSSKVSVNRQVYIAFDRNLSPSFIEFRLVSEQSSPSPGQFVPISYGNILSKHGFFVNQTGMTEKIKN